MKSLIIFTIVLLTTLQAQEAKTPPTPSEKKTPSAPSPTPYAPQNETLEITRIPLALTKLIFTPADALQWKQLSTETIKEKFESAIPEDHAAYNLTPTISAVIPQLKSSTTRWVLYDATKEEFVAKLSPSSTKHLKQILDDTLQDLPPQQISLQATITSVTRPKDAYLTWTQDLINQHNPKIVTTFSGTSRTGERTTIEVPSTKNSPHTLEFEPILSESLKYIDIRLALQIFPTKTYQGITLNTGLTLSSNEPFIHPIGISTNPNRITILTLHLKPITPEAKINH